MKHLFYLLLMVFTLPLQSQSVGVNYQALIRDAAGEPFANRTVNVFVDISTDGDVVYAEEFTGLTTDEYGLLQLVIGKGANQGIPFFLIDWSQGLYFLDLSIRSGDVGITLPRTQFRSVPCWATGLASELPFRVSNSPSGMKTMRVYASVPTKLVMRTSTW